MGDLLEIFSVSVWERTKHDGKACGDCKVSQRPLKTFLVTVRDPRGVEALYMVSIL